MATYKTFRPKTFSKSLVSAEVWKGTVDFGTQNAVNGDIIQALTIPANTIVLSAWVNVVKACTASTKANLGYSSDRDRWGAHIPLTTVGGEAFMDEDSDGGVVERSILAQVPFQVSTSTDIDLQMINSSTIAKGVVEVCALIVRLK